MSPGEDGPTPVEIVEAKRKVLSRERNEYLRAISYVGFVTDATDEDSTIPLSHLLTHYKSMTFPDLIALIEALRPLRAELGPRASRNRYLELCTGTYTVDTAYEARIRVRDKFESNFVSRFEQAVKKATTSEGYREVMRHADAIHADTRVWGPADEADGQSALRAINKVCTTR